jgi:hypothetical protein
MHTLATAAAAVGVNSSKVLSTDAVQRYAPPPNAPGSDAELSQRAKLAEQQVADLKAALENMKGERDRWRALSEHRSLPRQRAESNLTRSESREWWWRLNG